MKTNKVNKFFKAIAFTAIATAMALTTSYADESTTNTLFEEPITTTTEYFVVSEKGEYFDPIRGEVLIQEEDELHKVDTDAIVGLFGEKSLDETFLDLNEIIDEPTPVSTPTVVKQQVVEFTIAQVEKKVEKKVEPKKETPKVETKVETTKSASVNNIKKEEKKESKQVVASATVAQKTSVHKTPSNNVPETDILSNKPIDEARLRATLQQVAPNLVGIEDSVIDIYEQYGIKPSFQIAKFCLESGYGKSNLAVNKNNIAGWNAYPAKGRSAYQNATTFKSKDDCVYTVGHSLYKNYVSAGRTTVSSISTKYCPPNSAGWTSSVKSIMNKVERTYNTISPA